MSYLAVQNINNWLAITKYSVSEVNSDLEALAVADVLGVLDTRYDVSLWTDDTNTPDVVKSVLAMLVAAWEYDRAVSEDGEGDSYAVRLEGRARMLLGRLADGSIAVPGVEASDPEGPAFFPSDASTALYAEDSTAEGGSPMVFSMRDSF